MKNSAAVYFFKDEKSIVDDYVYYFLKELTKEVSHVVFVSGSELSDDIIKSLKAIVKEVIVDTRCLFEAEGYKKGIEYIESTMLSFESVTFCDYTLFGPFFNLSEMFDSMNETLIDFWGVTIGHEIANHSVDYLEYSSVPDYLRSFFITVNKKMFCSLEFKEYWSRLGTISSYDENFGRFEASFTKYFADRDFSWKSYIDTESLREYSQNPLTFIPKDLIMKHRCPFVSHDNFTLDYYPLFDNTMGQAPSELFNLIKKSLDYDINLIWDYLIRTCNMATLKNNLDLNLILPKNHSLGNVKATDKVALMMHIYFDDLIEYCYRYASSMPEHSDVIITTNSDEKKIRIEEVFESLNVNKVIVTVIENRGRDVSSLLVGCREYLNDYDYVCYMHDKKTRQYMPLTIGDTFAYKCFEGCLSTKEYVENIISVLRADDRLGMLMPPPPFHGVYFSVIGGEWGGNFQGTVELAEKLEISVPISEFHEPISPLGTMFWFKPKAMKPLIEYDWTYEDFPEEPNDTDGTILHHIERLYGFVPQSEGYYVSWVMTDQLAANEITNYNFTLREIMIRLYQKIHIGNFSYIIYAINELLNTAKNRNTFTAKKRMWIRRPLEIILPAIIFDKLLATKRRWFGPHY